MSEQLPISAGMKVTVKSSHRLSDGSSDNAYNGDVFEVIAVSGDYVVLQQIVNRFGVCGPMGRLGVNGREYAFVQVSDDYIAALKGPLNP